MLDSGGLQVSDALAFPLAEGDRPSLQSRRSQCSVGVVWALIRQCSLALAGWVFGYIRRGCGWASVYSKVEQGYDERIVQLDYMDG